MRTSLNQWSALICISIGLVACGDEATIGNPCGDCPIGYECVSYEYGSLCEVAEMTPAGDDGDRIAQPAPDYNNEDDGETNDDGFLPSGYTPGSSGQAGGGSNTGSNDECTSVQLNLKPSAASIPRVMLVVDRSYSMVGIEDRWTPIEETLSRVTASLSETVHFGLVLFPSPDPGFVGSEAEMACAPGEVNVSTGANTASDIQQWLRNAPPQMGLATPTYSALDAAGRSLAQNPSGNDYILLATDGGPGCNFNMNYNTCECLNHACLLGLPEMCLDNQRTVNKVQQLADDGIKTMVLGIASDEFMPAARSVLDGMAVAGGTAQNGRHLEVGRVNELERALTAAAGQLAPCTYDVGALAGQSEDLNITIDGEPIPRDESGRNGWDINGSDLEFFGDACNQLRDGQAHRIGAEANCQ